MQSDGHRRWVPSSHSSRCRRPPGSGSQFSGCPAAVWRRFPCSRGPVRSRNCRQIEVWDTLYPHPSPTIVTWAPLRHGKEPEITKIDTKNKKNREQNTFPDNFEKIEKSHFRSPEVGFGWIWGGILATFADLTVCPSRPERCRRPPRAATATASGAAGRGVGSLRASRRCKICPRDLPAPCGWVGAGMGRRHAAVRAS